MSISRRTLIQVTLAVVVLVFAAGMQTFAAFSEPSAAPPSSDAYAPLTTSPTAESKAGGLLLNTGGAATGLIVQSGNVGIGTTSPATLLDASGHVGATAYCDENGQNCVTASQVSGGSSSVTAGRNVYACPVVSDDCYYRVRVFPAGTGGCNGQLSVNSYCYAGMCGSATYGCSYVGKIVQ